MKRGDLLLYKTDGSLWIVEWADGKWVKIAGIVHTILIEESGLVVVSESR